MTIERTQTRDPTAPLVDQVFYGVGKFIENRTPVAHQEQIIYLINRFIIPKLSPKQMEWVGKHKDAIETAALVAGVGVTTAEIVGAVMFGKKLVDLAAWKIRTPVARRVRERIIVAPSDATRRMWEGSVLVGGLGVAAGLDGVREIRDEIERLFWSGDPQKGKQAERLKLEYEHDLRYLDRVEQSEEARRLREYLKKHGGDQGEYISPKERQAFAKLKAESVAYEKAQVAKKRVEERERGRLITLADELGGKTSWRNPEVVGVLERARRRARDRKKLATYNFGRLLDAIDEAREKDPLVDRLLSQLRWAQRYNDQEAVTKAAEWLLDRMKEYVPMVASRYTMGDLARYWVERLGLAGAEKIFSPKHPVLGREEYLTSLMRSKDPGFMVSQLMRRLAQVPKDDWHVASLVEKVVSRGYNRADDTHFTPGPHSNLIQPTPELLKLLREGYRLLRSDQSDKDRLRTRQFVVKMGGNPFKYGRYISDKEEAALLQLATWVVRHDPEHYLRPVLKLKKFVRDPEFTPKRDAGWIFRHLDEIDRLQPRKNKWPRADDIDYLRTETHRELIGKLVRQLVILKTNPEAERLVRALRQEQGYRIDAKGTLQPTPSLVQLVLFALREYKKQIGLSWQRQDSVLARRLARQFAEDNLPNINALDKAFPKTSPLAFPL